MAKNPIFQFSVYIINKYYLQILKRRTNFLMEVFTHVISLFSRKSSKVKAVAHCQILELVKNVNFDFDIILKVIALPLYLPLVT